MESKNREDMVMEKQHVMKSTPEQAASCERGCGNAVQATLLRGGMLCIAAACLLTVVQTGAAESGGRHVPVLPRADEQIIRDQVIVIVDETGSIGTTRKFRYERSLVQGFTAAMPDGSYESGLDSFAGVASKYWVKEPLAPFYRETMVNAADSLEPLGSLTPLARAIGNQTGELEGLGGNAALVIYSDGKVRNPEEVLQACRDLDTAHGGSLCIFTIQIGESDRGRELLQAMATVTGCGKYYDGATLDSVPAMEVLVREVFFGPMPVPPAPVVPAPAPAPMAWKINNINFDNDSSVVAPSYDSLLNEAASILKENPAVQIRLQGHTDFNASDAYNQKLSERRVNAVKDALVKRNADANRLPTSAYGESQPMVPNDSPEHLHTNRRVELKVTE
jgi:OOP family OmpA-OmpF porin